MSELIRKPVRRLYIDDQGTFVGKAKNVLINWGSSALPARLLTSGRVVNHPTKVARAANKLTTFQRLKEVGSISIPEFTTNYEEAVAWVNDGRVVVCRTKLNGHSGAGIVMAARQEDVVQNCPLYVRYVKKIREYRVHVAFGQVIDVQAKRKRSDFEGEVNYGIRNHHTGWVYCREDVVEPENLRAQALATVQALELDFGAVDIIYNDHQKTCYVLEVNCAPGLEGTSVENYANAFVGELVNA
jgi:glutathione synthase/RimK-type ligase-like ATP-grasp enzyme